jgi:hypothetical protein
MAGRNDSIVSSSIVCTLNEYVVPPFGPGLVLKAGKPAVCANDSVGSASISAGNATDTRGAARRNVRSTVEATREVRLDCAQCAD